MAIRARLLAGVALFCLLSAPGLAEAQAAGEAGKVQSFGARADEFDLTKNEFKDDTRFGLVFQTGNTKSLVLSAGSYTLYRIKRWENKWKFGALFNRIYTATSSTVTPGTIANYIYGTYRLDYYLTERFTLFVGGGGYTDEIKGMDLSFLGFAGAGYFFWRNPKTYLRGSLGYAYTFEDPVAPNPDDNIHSIAEELEFLYKFNDNVGFFQNVNALENVEDGHDVRVNSDTEIRAGIIKHLAVVTAFRIRFDNQPVPGFKKLDTITDVSLALTY
jgi:putative salt-induced outer membrane protein YdiY